MRRYFYGVKVQVWFLKLLSLLSLGLCQVVKAMYRRRKKLPMYVAQESNIYRDKAYTDYTIEEDSKQGDDINLLIKRKSNSTKNDEPWMRFI